MRPKRSARERVMITLSADVRAVLRQVAEDEGMNMSVVVEQAIREYVRKLGYDVRAMRRAAVRARQDE